MTTRAKKHERDGLTFPQIVEMFKDEDKARKWIEEQRWPEGPHCPHCGSVNMKIGVRHKSMTLRCNDCPKKTMFTGRVGSVMHGSKLPYRVWAVGIYLFTTSVKGISSMNLHRELGIGQKAAWFMLHRLLHAYASNGQIFEGPVETGTSHMCSMKKNKHSKKKLKAEGATGQGVGRAADSHSVGKYARAQAPVAGVDLMAPRGLRSGALS